MDSVRRERIDNAVSAASHGVGRGQQVVLVFKSRK
jgi:hypothetical protein